MSLTFNGDLKMGKNYKIILTVVVSLTATLGSLPTLLSQTEVWFVSTPSIWDEWWGDYKGDGPGKEEENNADLPQSTNDYVLPRLSHPPKAIATGMSYAIVQWQKQHTGNGPICAYAIDRRSIGKDVPSWSTVGFVSEQSGSQPKEELTFNITGLKPEMGYRVTVRPVLCDGARASEVGEGLLLLLKTSSIVLPTLMEAPLIANLSSTNVAIRWTNHYQGDGPICGYGINIKKNDKDRGDDESSESWRSVGYVSVESELLYYVGHLEANTTYQVAVSLINCISAREGPRKPTLQCTTKTVTLPVVEPQTMPPSISTSTVPPCPAKKWRECPQNPPKDDYPWKWMFFIALFLLLVIIFLILVVIFSICCT